MEKSRGQWQMTGSSCLLLFFLPNDRTMFFFFDICIPQGRWRGGGHRRKHDRAWDTITPVQPNMKQSFSFGLPQLVRAGSTSSSDKLLPLFDSSRILSHCRGFGTRISAKCSNGIWVHLDPCWYFLWCVTDYYSTCQIVLICHPELLAQTHPQTILRHVMLEKQEHLARRGNKSGSMILF